MALNSHTTPSTDGSHVEKQVSCRVWLIRYFYAIACVLAVVAIVNIHFGGEQVVNIIFVFPLLAAVMLHLNGDVWRRRALRGCLIVLSSSLVFLASAIFKDMNGGTIILGVELSKAFITAVLAAISAIASAVPTYLLMSERVCRDFI